MIAFCSNSTGWDDEAGALVPGGQVDRLIAPVIAHLPEDSYQVTRQPVPGAANVYLSNRDRYLPRSRARDRTGVSYAHGLADKGYRRANRTASFDYVTVPGPAFVPRLLAGGLPARRVIEIGYPKLDALYDAPKVPREPGGRVRVLYAPTHGGGSERWTQGRPTAPGARATSWWHRDTILSLLGDFDVTLAPHPRHHPQRRATHDEYLSADVVIADGGSTIYEAMALGLPVVLPAWLTAERNLQRQAGTLLEARVYRERLGYHADAPEELADRVHQAAAERLGEREQRFMEAVLPKRWRGTSGARLAAVLTDIDTHGRRHAAAGSRRVTGAGRRSAQAGPAAHSTAGI